MAPLKSLEKEHPLIDSNFQSFCASNGIFSDFLLHDLDTLIALADNHSTSQTLKQGIDQLLSIIDALHPPLLNGLQLLEDAQRNKHVLSTGCEGIDVLLGGGLREGQLTELVGSSSSGKTQACLLSASTVAKRKSSVIYLDTGNSFSPQRIACFVGQSSGYVFDNQVDHIIKKVLDRIICYPVFDIYQMFDVLHQLKINLRSEVMESDQHVRLLIVDSISSLITPILGGSGPQGHALMISAGFLLKKLAHEHNIAVLILDFGTIDHMTQFPSHFTSYSKASKEQLTTVAKLANNLISIPRLIQDWNCAVTFFHSHCVFQDLVTWKTIKTAIE
ncbi:DNA repair protein RAD51-like 4 [Mucuna pruriens]|uniref:DNA repair protein RAD51-like 4 n=1 Tax=Mucuna pruriens TaxID=157652 RepID=A0A371GZ84_MUCPR|nr:DNA repair protein RAD51-like 4 [Mucuna pruriens]